MFRIRRINDDRLSANRAAIADVALLARDQFPAATTHEVDSRLQSLRNPLMPKFYSVFGAAENARSRRNLRQCAHRQRRRSTR